MGVCKAEYLIMRIDLLPAQGAKPDRAPEGMGSSQHIDTKTKTLHLCSVNDSFTGGRMALDSNRTTGVS